MHDWAHREETLRVNEYNHALEPELAGRWKHILRAHRDHFVAEDEAHAEFTFEAGPEVDRNLDFLVRAELERLLILTHELFDV